jgi:hypothetical protein
VTLPRVLKDRRLRYLTIAGAIFAAGLAANVWFFPHYLAPFTAGFYAIMMQCMRHLRAGRPSGRALVRLLPPLCVALAVFRLAAVPLKIEIPRWPSMWYGTEPLGLPRADVAARISSQGGNQLAIVRYAASHVPFDDWVYNAADIDHSRIVWAREIDWASDTRLVAYFRDRKAWLIEPDAVPPRVTPWNELK